MYRYQHGCPQSFNCGKLGPIKFPFSNDTYPRCGLCTVNCSELVPKLHFWSMEERYEVEEFLNDEAVNLLPHPTPSVSYTISPNLTLFKCPTNSNSKPQLQTEVYSFSNCSGYTLYYTDPNQHTPTPTNLSSDCVVIQLPMLPSIRNQTVSDLFSLLAYEFTIGLHVSKECNGCRHNEGQCPPHGFPEFHCLKDEGIGISAGISNLKLILEAGSNGQESMYQHGCPQSFNCGNLGQIKFPLFDINYPRCGLCKVDCSLPVPKIKLKHQWYEVKKFLSNEAIEVSYKPLGQLIRRNSCEIFNNLTLPSKDSISFTISPSLTLFKCNTSSNNELNLHAHDYFRGNHSFQGCLNHTVYYTYPNPHVQTPNNLPRNCEVIQLPVVPPIRNPNVSDLFSLLSDEFTFGLHVSNECRKCHVNSGQCHGEQFHCIMDEKQGGSGGGGGGGGYGNEDDGGGCGDDGRNNLKLILGTGKLSLSESRVFWKNRSESYQNVENILKNYESFSPKRYTYSDIKKMTNSFRVKLGQGGFGCVFKGTLENGGLVAVKVLKGLKGSGEEFINEVVAISRTSHVNIVTLLGFCFEGRNRALIYEFMPNGSLERFIYDRNSAFRQLGRETLYQIAVGISRGLEYLHRGCNMRILHFDIKPHNVLLDEDFCPKISDFGLAKLCPQKESIISLLGTRGTAGYIAPEVFCRSFGGVSHKSDVYSYGMMILEMVGGRKNIDDGVDQTTELCFPHWIYKRLELDEELRLQGNVNEEANESARKMIIVGLWCIQTDPSHRPAMSKVVEMLEGSPESLQIPPKPFLSSPSRSPAESSTTHFITVCD
ncbi:unnamed protein product [Camellia sinensis]